ncbi:MAG TPA: VPDSG-CTERM sorting domain-containing protein [Opitutaceae bacterium]|nr:VPDSG-CTERM sorting domain-containing protein [Opitutaceae bacterium]
MKLLSTTLFAAGLTLASSAHAAGIFFDAQTHQLTPQVGMSFSATGGTTVYGSKEGIGFIGVTGGGAGDEIDEGQSLSVNFVTPQLFTTLTFGLLYDGDEFGDLFEIAGATINGSSFVFKLSTLTSTTASWSGVSGTVINLSPAQLGSAGVWQITNPFGNEAVSTLTLSPVASQGGSDFGLVSFSTRDPKEVPDAGSTLSMLALGLVGLVAWSKRRRA